MAKKRRTPDIEPNGLVHLNDAQNNMLASLTKRRAEIDAQLKTVLETIAAGEGITKCGNIEMDTDKKTVQFMPVAEAGS